MFCSSNRNKIMKRYVVCHYLCLKYECLFYTFVDAITTDLIQVC